MRQGPNIGPMLPKGGTKLDSIILIDYVPKYSFPFTGPSYLVASVFWNTLGYGHCKKHDGNLCPFLVTKSGLAHGLLYKSHEVGLSYWANGENQLDLGNYGISIQILHWNGCHIFPQWSIIKAVLKHSISVIMSNFHQGMIFCHVIVYNTLSFFKLLIIFRSYFE